MDFKKKKIGILTFHKATNPGAYLQCFALVKVLQNFDYDVEVINYINTKHIFDEYKGSFMVKNPIFLIENIIKILKFNKDCKKFPLSKIYFTKKKTFGKYYDVIVVGSDIVWDFKNLAYGIDLVYFGYFLNTKKLISYAVSFGAINKEEMIPDIIKKGIQKFKKISVRDTNSADIIKKIGIRDVQVVVDPTLLYDFSGDEIDCNLSDFILVYAFCIEDYQKDQIKKFAKEKCLKIVAITYKQNWCDKNVVALGPFEWLGYFKKAKYVFTSTFHGTLFSIKYKKNFVTIPNNSINNKIRYILDTLNLNNRIWNEKEKLDDIINNNIDYTKVGVSLNKLTEDSLKFLNEAIN